MINEGYIDRVKALARLAAEENEFPVAALVIQDDQVIAEGRNQKESLNDPTAHAEVLAIREAVKHHGDWRLTGTTLLTTLEPCPMCLGAIIHARLAKIVYLAKDIRLNNNKLTALPRSFCNLINLEGLYLDNNYLRSINHLFSQ